MAKEEKDRIQINLVFEGTLKERLEYVKRHYGLQTYADTVRLLITREYERLRERAGSP